MMQGAGLDTGVWRFLLLSTPVLRRCGIAVPRSPAYVIASVPIHAAPARLF
jgi:hypothetical protein